MREERPILFKSPMVRAILANRKTQTRRVVKPQPVPFAPNYPNPEPEALAAIGKPWMPVGGVHVDRWTNRFGQVGDRLWVKETWKPCFGDGSGTAFRADRMPGSPEDRGPWKSPLFMRREQSRITLEITGIRCERLNEISPDDARAEGCGTDEKPWKANPALHSNSWVATYATLWESINGHGSWEANPWVWVIEFRRVEP